MQAAPFGEIGFGKFLPLPKRGPALYSVSAFQNRSVPAVSSVGPVVFQFPRALFVTGVLVIPQSGDPADSALFSLRIQDETFSDIFADGQGTGFAASACGLNGISFKPWPLQRPVLDNDQWLFTLSNADPALAKVCAGVFLFFNDGLRSE